MKKQKISTIAKLTIIPFLMLLLISSCSKEKGITEEGFPTKITLENWEQFVYAPQHVIDFHAERERANISKADQEVETSPRVTTTFQGSVKAFSSGWVQMANTLVEGRFSGDNDFIFAEITDLSAPYNWSSSSPFNDVTIRTNWYYKGINATYTSGDWLNGVSTFDLVKIQRHILGLEPFTSIRQVIAADVNYSGTVTSADLSAVYSLILGNSSSLPAGAGGGLCTSQNQPFFYVPAYEEWETLSLNDPFLDQYLQILYTNNCSVDLPIGGVITTNANAIKRGDVTGNWSP